jgi:hypothetical protein
MSKQTGSWVALGIGLAIALVAGAAYEILRGTCYLADLAAGRRAK